ncbi:PadR family transcriptional regulator [Microbacterium binotii]|uniref:PadR family transcriptional regulator n=1 Tax=Microbacterium binotii TaxID=462710 RepID=UPI001F3964B8|nr:PadR family transcriptional regulator [Microbacterium binotii]UIN30813.1 PadR family transcriptional regulator [Microbacterium binotii]
MTTRITPLGIMVLALLREDPMHPYEMLRLMRLRHDDRILNITGGTVYHTVARLEKAGLIAEAGTEREGNRPERTTYALTDAGLASLDEWIRTELVRIDHPVEFRVALAEAHNLDRDDAAALLALRRAALTEQIADIAAGLNKARRGGVSEQYLIEVDRSHALAEADLAWLDAFLGRLGDPSFAWGPDAHDRTSDRYLTQRKAARE